MTIGNDKPAMIKSCASAAIAFAAALTASSASAESPSVADFYRGKTVSIVVGSDVGGGYDLNARVLTHHLGRHIPGNPGVIVQNKPGASSLAATNYVYELAPKDGTVIGEPQRPIPFPTLFVDG